ncbi:unnamed protein product [Toxocara canis]|uniref:Rx_N domain-containing protein n=1 Tax=Toxocara canis TaxID=6265 RepID=A0A183UM30_TOXCA|nr:unnamed protein product [Toxocara canis]
MVEIDLDELAKKIAARLLPPLTSALSNELQAALQPVVDELDKLIELMATDQSLATESWIESLLYSVMSKEMQMDRNVLDEKNV